MEEANFSKDVNSQFNKILFYENNWVIIVGDLYYHHLFIFTNLDSKVLTYLDFAKLLYDDMDYTFNVWLQQLYDLCEQIFMKINLK